MRIIETILSSALKAELTKSAIIAAAKGAEFAVKTGWKVTLWGHRGRVKIVWTKD